MMQLQKIFLFFFTAGFCFAPFVIKAQVFAIDDVVFTNEETPIVIDVQFNDLNLGAGSLYTYNISFPNHGEITILDSDSILYTPNENYYGVDTFSYGIYNDDEIPAFSSAQVILNILSVPDYPIAINDFDTTTVETAIIIDVQANDINVDPEFLETAIISSPDNGTVALAEGDKIEYTPAADYYGDDVFSYAVCKAGSVVYCDTGFVFMHIEPVNFFSPELVNDFADVVLGATENINVLFNDTDADGDALQVTELIYSDIEGIVFLNADYTVSYTANSTAKDSIQYVACDINSPSFCDTALLVVNVSDVLVPNSFSPNGDSKNDFLVISGLENYPSFHLKIFNRWGDLVFENTDASVYWDGKPNVKTILPAHDSAEGTYFYLLEIETQTSQKGYIELRK